MIGCSTSIFTQHPRSTAPASKLRFLTTVEIAAFLNLVLVAGSGMLFSALIHHREVEPFVAADRVWRQLNSMVRHRDTHAEHSKIG